MSPPPALPTEKTGGWLDVLNALRGIKFTVVAGTTADTNIVVTGIATNDILAAVIRLNRDATAANIDMDDLTAEAAITSAGNIQLDTTVTTGDKLLVIWFDVT